VKKSCIALVLSLALFAPALAVAEPAVYKVDTDHSGVSFTIRHFVSNVPGRFEDFTGTIKYDPQNPGGSSVEFTVQVTSIDTANSDRDNHLRAPDFFDAQKFPTWTFVSNKVARKDANTLDVTGDLTIKGVTKRVTLPIQVLGTAKTPRGEKAGFETSFTIDRKDYGIEWNRVLDTGGPMLGNDVKITISIEANREAPAPAAPKAG
jgi:polyisoprenoid-binding protein YceI